MMTKRKTLLLNMLISILLLTQCNLKQTTSKIVFVSDREGNLDIFSMNTDGSNLIQLTSNIADDSKPRWSPDGKWIVFQSNRDQNPEKESHQNQIYIMDNKGNRVQRLTYNNSNNSSPSWSPNGDWIAYESNINGYSDIYIMKSDGSQNTRLTFHSAIDSSPSWFPDGEHILFDSNRYKHPAVFGGQLFKININNLKLTSITEEGFPHINPSISPNGEKIIFTTLLHPRIHILELESIDESMHSALISYPPPSPSIETPSEDNPSWLQDSENIIFAWGKDGDGEIYTMNILNQQTTQLTDNTFLDFEPDWWSNNN